MEPPKDHKLPSRDCCSPFAADMMVVQLQLYKGSRLIWPPYDMNTAKLVAFLDNPACLLSVTSGGSQGEEVVQLDFSGVVDRS
jgi:hypothetical protein